MQYQRSRRSEINVTLGGILLCAVVAAASFAFARHQPPVQLTAPVSAQAIPAVPAS